MSNKGRTIAIGDIHGCLHTMLDLLKIIDPAKGDTVIFLGDYIDRGPYSMGVVETTMSLQEMNPETYIALKGNHEDMCVDYHRPNGGNGDSFIVNGGTETIQSFGGRIEDVYLDWMDSLPTLIENEHGYFCHAGFLPNVLPADQAEDVKMWVRHEFLESEFVWDKPIIHGHTPHSSVVISPRRVGLDTGCVFGNSYGGAYGQLSAIDLTNERIFQVSKSELDN